VNPASPSRRAGAASENPDSLPTRSSLLSRLRDLGDSGSWRDFFETYWRLLYNVARKSGLADAEAQDVVQDTVIAVARKMPGFHYDPARDRSSSGCCSSRGGASKTISAGLIAPCRSRMDLRPNSPPA